MSQAIKFTIIRSLAVNSAKNETFQKGNIDKAVDAKNTAAAYQEQAGDDPFHERMLSRSFYSQVEKLKTWFSDYLSGNGNLAEDPIVAEEEEDAIEITLLVSDRFNRGYVKTLARLSQKYVEDRMVHLWWSVSDEKKSAYYAQLAEEDLEGIMKCFTKKAPDAPAYNFPTGIELRYPIIPERNSYPGYITPSNSPTVPVEQLYNNPFIIGRGEESEISYTLTGEGGKKPIDDIIVRCDDGCCMAALTPEGRWCLKAKSAGYTIVTLFSRHNDQVFNKFAVRVV